MPRVSLDGGYGDFVQLECYTVKSEVELATRYRLVFLGRVMRTPLDVLLHLARDVCMLIGIVGPDGGFKC